MSTSLREAKRKIQENNFAFEDLPDDTNNFIWHRLLEAPYNLSLPELSVLINDRCVRPGKRSVPTIGQLVALVMRLFLEVVSTSDVIIFLAVVIVVVVT